MLLEIIIGLAVVIIVWDYTYRLKWNSVMQRNGISGPRLMPILGVGYLLAGINPETMFKFLDDLRTKFGKQVRVWLFFEKAVMISDPKLFEAIFTSQKLIAKNRLYDLLHYWLGDGLLVSNGRKWHQRRKIITPTFHFQILNDFVDIFDQQSSVMAERLYKQADGKTAVDMFPVACLCALDIMSESAMGVKVNAQIDPNFPYVQALTRTAKGLADRFVSATNRYDALMKIFSPLEFRRQRKQMDLMHEFADKVIRDRQMALQQSMANEKHSETSEEDSMGIKKRMAFLDILLRSTIDGQPLSNADIREEVDTFMFEGHDTTTSGIAHTLYLLSRYPAVQQKVFEEIRQVIGDDKTKAISIRELQDLKYLECVIKESMRLYPPVPMIGRYVEEDIVLDGKLYPANTNLTLLIHQACRDADYFEQPNEFLPERFDGSSQINPFAYVPFSAGPRNCIGQKFAILELKSTVSKMLRHFELLPLGEEIRPVMNLILRSATGAHVGLKPRVYS